MLASNGERKIHTILTECGVPFEEEYSFDDLRTSNGRHLFFDFAVFDEDNNLVALIEFQGRQHYQPVAKFGGQKGLNRQRYNDTLKRKYCLKHNYKLISIP